tara:strand:- start:18120 stop:18677 length:558 start_codon:yes stop_codon:yes gene_type:complete
MSKLFVDEIKGNTGTTVTVPTGQTLAVAANQTIGGTLAVTGVATNPGKPAWYFSIGDGHSANGTGLTADPVTWGYQVLSNGITIASNQTITVPTTGMYWISMGGIKGSNTGTASRMGMMLNTSTNTGIQLRGEENSAYAQMAGSFAVSLTAGNTLHCYISGQGMWNGGNDALATNSPYWSGYLIG